jgi:hypothetical protein
MNAYAHLEATSIRRLQPQDTLITEGEHGMMTCQISGEAARHGVFASMLFPITHPEQFISLRYTDAEEKERELGVIGHLADFPPDVVKRVRASLVKQYHEQIIHRIVKIKCKWGQLFITVGTQRGIEEIVMPWRQDRAEDYGTSGKVLLDSLNNRYILPDVDALSPKEQRVFRNYIYW